MDRVFGTGPLLVLAPHADDETLGCAALLADCWRGGRCAHVVCLTDGAASHPRSTADVAAIRAKELACAIEILGGAPDRDLTCLGHPDAGLHTVLAERLAAQVEAVICRLGIGTVIAPSPLDPHCDHVTAATLAETLVATRSGLALLYYPIWSRWIGCGTAPAVSGTRRRRHPVDAVLKARAIAVYASQQGHVIRDDASGFVMPDGFAAMFTEGPEIYDERVG